MSSLLDMGMNAMQYENQEDTRRIFAAASNTSVKHFDAALKKAYPPSCQLSQTQQQDTVAKVQDQEQEQEQEQQTEHAASCQPASSTAGRTQLVKGGGPRGGGAGAGTEHALGGYSYDDPDADDGGRDGGASSSSMAAESESTFAAPAPTPAPTINSVKERVAAFRAARQECKEHPQRQVVLLALALIVAGTILVHVKSFQAYPAAQVCGPLIAAAGVLVFTTVEMDYNSFFMIGRRLEVAVPTLGLRAGVGQVRVGVDGGTVATLVVGLLT